MDHDIVDRGTDGCREAFETEEAGNRTVVADESLGYLIQRFRCHTRGNRFTDFGQRLRDDDGIFAKQLDLFFSLGLDHNRSI